MNPLLQKFEMLDDAMADILRQKNPSGTIADRRANVEVCPCDAARSDSHHLPRMARRSSESGNRSPDQSRSDRP